jgi:N utilization substance protein B
MNRHLSRLVAMQTLYEIEFRPKASKQEILDRNFQEFSGAVDDKFILNIVDGLIKNRERVDELICKNAPEWPIEQIAPLDKIILEIATLELIKPDDVPPKVAIDEAVELAKQFCSENSSKFVNGVLGSIYKEVVDDGK